MCIILLCFSVNSVLGQNCRNFGFEKDSDLMHFNGNIGQSDLASKEGSNSLRIKDAQPGHDQEVEASVISNDGPGVIKFFWEKSGDYAKFFKLSFYFDDKYIDECKNINDLGSTKLYYKVQDDGKTIHTMKWVLNYKERGYAGAPPTIPPTADAFIDGLELCNMRFQDEPEENNTTKIVETEIVETSKIHSPQNILKAEPDSEENNTTKIMEMNVVETSATHTPSNFIKVEPDSDRNLQEIIDMIKEMQSKGNYTIKRLILSPSNYKYELKDSLILEGLKDLSIECEDYANGNLAKFDISTINATIVLRNCTNVDINGLKIDDGKCGIYLERSYVCEISNNVISNTKCGIALKDSNDNYIENNRINSGLDRSTGVNLLNSSSNNIKSNSISVDNECYSIKSSSNGNYILDGNPNGLISVFGKAYEICPKEKGFKEVNSRRDCLKKINCIGDNIFEKSVT